MHHLTSNSPVLLIQPLKAIQDVVKILKTALAKTIAQIQK